MELIGLQASVAVAIPLRHLTSVSRPEYLRERKKGQAVTAAKEAAMEKSEAVVALERRVAELQAQVRELEGDVAAYLQFFRVLGDLCKRMGSRSQEPKMMAGVIQAAMEGRVKAAEPEGVVSVEDRQFLARVARATDEGNFGLAESMLREALVSNPQDIRLQTRLADVLARAGKMPEAVGMYLTIAANFAADGVFLKAVAVYKQILTLDPKQSVVHDRLASLYQKLGMITDAVREYEFVVLDAKRQGDELAVLAALREMVAMDPENVLAQLRLGEAYAWSGYVDNVIVHLRTAALLFRGQGQHADAARVEKRIAKLGQPETAAVGDATLVEGVAMAYVELVQDRDDGRRWRLLNACCLVDPSQAKERLEVALRQLLTGLPQNEVAGIARQLFDVIVYLHYGFRAEAVLWIEQISIAS